MIIGVHKGKSILYAPDGHIAIPVPAEGDTVGVASQISHGCWPALAARGELPLGQARHHKLGEKTLHALVCHTFSPKGWERTAEYLEESLDLFRTAPRESVAIMMVGYGLAPQRTIDDVLAVMAASDKRLNVYLSF